MVVNWILIGSGWVDLQNYLTTRYHLENNLKKYKNWENILKLHMQPQKCICHFISNNFEKTYAHQSIIKRVTMLDFILHAKGHIPNKI